MADINVERKGPSIWPWVIGLLVLALLIWAIAEMVDTDDADQVAETEVERVEEPPAAVPTPAPTQPGMENAVEIETLAPLETADVGRQVRLQGEVVGQPSQDGFWVRLDYEQPTDQAQADQQRPEVLFVQAPAWTQDGDQLMIEDIQEGQNVELFGTLQRMDSEQAQQHMQESQLEQEEAYQDWTVVQDLMLTSQTTGQQDQQMQPGQRQDQMEQDTVQGRY